MADVVVYHNPACSNSRGTLDLLDDAGIEPEVIEYLHEPPDRAALERVQRLIAKRDLVLKMQVVAAAAGN